MIPAGSHGAHFYNANASTFTNANASSLPVSTRGLPWDVQSNFTISSNAAVSSGTPALALVDLGYNDTSSYVEFPTNSFGGIAFWGNKDGTAYYVAVPYYTVTSSTTGSCATTVITGTCNTSLVSCPPPYYTTTQASCYCSGCVSPCYGPVTTNRTFQCNFPGQTFAIGNCTYTCQSGDVIGGTIVRSCYAVSCTQTITCSANTCTGSGCIPTGCACGVTYTTSCTGPNSTCSGVGCVPNNCCQGSGATGGPITSFTANTAYRDFPGDVNVTIEGGASFRVRFEFDSSITGSNDKYKSTTTLLTSGNGYFVGEGYTFDEVYAATAPGNVYQDGAVTITITGVSGGAGTAPSGITYTTTSTYTTGVRILRYANNGFTVLKSGVVKTSSSAYQYARAMSVITDGKSVTARLYSAPNSSWRTSPNTNVMGSGTNGTPITYSNTGIVLNTSVGLSRPTGIGSSSSNLDNYEVDTRLK